MNPVSWKESYPVLELFVENEAQLKDQDLVDEDLVLVIEGDYLVLDESVADNILLRINTANMDEQIFARADRFQTGDNVFKEVVLTGKNQNNEKRR